MLSCSKPQQHVPKGSMVQGQLWPGSVAGGQVWVGLLMCTQNLQASSCRVDPGELLCFLERGGNKLDKRRMGICLSFLWLQIRVCIQVWCQGILLINRFSRPESTELTYLSWPRPPKCAGCDCNIVSNLVLGRCLPWKMERSGELAYPEDQRLLLQSTEASNILLKFLVLKRKQ